MGTFRFKTKLLAIVNGLGGQHIGLDAQADGVWSICFGDVRLATIDGRND